MVKLLLDRGADIATELDNGETLLLRGILSENSYPVVKLLIERGADVNHSNNDKETPLMKAASYNGLYEIVQLLLQSGASKDGKDVYGKTAINYAEETADRTGDRAILDLLRN
ncbi:Ankyrin repeats (3 copies) [compost metagenome]